MVTLLQAIRQFEFSPAKIGGRAQALDKLKRPAQAVADWEQAIELATGQQRQLLRSQLGCCLARSGDHVRAARDAKTVADASQIVAAMEKTTDSRVLSSLGRALGALAVGMEAEDTSSVLKSIVCVDGTREKVLAGLEKKTGQEFDGNLWKAVKWLEEKKGGDLKNVPRINSR